MHFHDLIHQQTLFTHSIMLQLQCYIAIHTHSMHVVKKVLTSSMEAMLFVVSRLRSRSSASIHIPSKLTPSVCNAGVAASPLKSITAHFSMPATARTVTCIATFSTIYMHHNMLASLHRLQLEFENPEYHYLDVNTYYSSPYYYLLHLFL